MIRIFPTAWTAAYVAFTSLTTWLLCETDALGGRPAVFPLKSRKTRMCRDVHTRSPLAASAQRW